MARGFGSSASDRACMCKEKNKDNWTIIGYTGRMKDGYTVSCSKCKNQWDTKAKYCKDLKKASYLKEISKNSKTIECPECGCKDGNHAQECSIYYNVGYGKKK